MTVVADSVKRATVEAVYVQIDAQMQLTAMWHSKNIVSMAPRIWPATILRILTTDPPRETVPMTLGVSWRLCVSGLQYVSVKRNKRCGAKSSQCDDAASLQTRSGREMRPDEKGSSGKERFWAESRAVEFCIQQSGCQLAQGLERNAAVMQTGARDMTGKNEE